MNHLDFGGDRLDLEDGQMKTLSGGHLHTALGWHIEEALAGQWPMASGHAHRLSISIKEVLLVKSEQCVFKSWRIMDRAIGNTGYHLL